MPKSIHTAPQNDAARAKRAPPQVKLRLDDVDLCSGPVKLDSDFETVYSPERGRYPCKNIVHSNLSSRLA